MKERMSLSDVSKKFEEARDLISSSLPRHMNADRMIEQALNACRDNPRLLDCDQDSLVAAVVKASRLGLECDGTFAQGYLRPIRNKRRNCQEAQFIPGWRGLVELAMRSGKVKSIEARVVRDGDVFEFQYGSNASLTHRPKLGSSGKVIAVYAGAAMTNGQYVFDVLDPSEVNAIRDHSDGYMAALSGGFKSPWQTDWNEMAKKTAIRRLVKILPTSAELSDASDLDDESGQVEEPAQAEDVPVEIVSPEPGKVINLVREHSFRNDLMAAFQAEGFQEDMRRAFVFSVLKVGKRVNELTQDEARVVLEIFLTRHGVAA